MFVKCIHFSSKTYIMHPYSNIAKNYVFNLMLKFHHVRDTCIITPNEQKEK